MHRRAGFHIAGTRSRPASGRRPNIAGNRLRWRAPTGIRAKFSETTGEAPTYTTAWGRLKQPDKQKLAKRQDARLCSQSCRRRAARAGLTATDNVKVSVDGDSPACLQAFDITG